MTPEQRTSWAKQLLENPVLGETLSKLEEAAVSAFMYAKADEHDLRQAIAAELRAIRKLRDAIASEASPASVTRVKSIA